MFSLHNCESCVHLYPCYIQLIAEQLTQGSIASHVQQIVNIVYHKEKFCNIKSSLLQNSTTALSQSCAFNMIWTWMYKNNS